jgi:hypothetical protein
MRPCLLAQSLDGCDPVGHGLCQPERKVGGLLLMCRYALHSAIHSASVADRRHRANRFKPCVCLHAQGID